MSAYYSRNQSYSRSLNAEIAEDEGRMPLSRAKIVVAKKYACPQTTAAAALTLLHDGEWHHVGKYATEVNYHDTADERLGGVIAHITACGGARKWAKRRDDLRATRRSQWQLPRQRSAGRILAMADRKRKAREHAALVNALLRVAMIFGLDRAYEFGVGQGLSTYEICGLLCDAGVDWRDAASPLGRNMERLGRCK